MTIERVCASCLPIRLSHDTLQPPPSTYGPGAYSLLNVVDDVEQSVAKYRKRRQLRHFRHRTQLIREQR